MRIKSLITIVAVVAFGLTASAFELGKTDAVIYCNKVNATAAAEVSSLLNKVFGKKYTLKSVKKITAQPGIFVGFQPKQDKINVPADKEFTAISAYGDQLFIYGRDNRYLDCTGYAVAEFLEKYAGVRFLWPGETGTVADRRKPVTVKPGLDLYIPPFDLRLTSSFHYGSRNRTVDENRDLDNWLNHNKVGQSVRAHRGSGFQHAFENLMPREVYGKEHPEYYSLVSPERWIGEPKPDKPTRLSDPTMPGPWQLCTSNPDVRRIIAEKLAATGSEGIQSISPNDGYGFCECENCKAIANGDNTDIEEIDAAFSVRPLSFEADELVRQADRIAVLEEGTILHCGTHEELLEKSETYRDIYDSQMKSGAYMEGGAANE